MQEKLPLWRKIVKAVLASLLTVLLLAAFYIAVVMGNPQKDDSSAGSLQAEQPLPEAMSSPIMITQNSQLSALLEFFPGQVMAAMNTSVLSLQHGLCEDVPFEAGLARRVTLTYRTTEDALVTLVSIYPARATSLITKGDYVLSDTFGLPLAGLRSVRMEKPGSICMHAQGVEALYVVTLPELSASALRALTTTFQLYQGD